MKERVCIIGSGISGLTCCHLLAPEYDIELIEAGSYIGGHTNTEDVKRPDGNYRINTGFIVFNKENYPNFLKLINRLGVEYQTAPMSFSVKCGRTGLEYGFATMNAVFAQRRNIFSPKFLRMLREISGFRKEFSGLLSDPASGKMSVGDYLSSRGYSNMFIEQFIFPFAAAIWSADYDKINKFPLRTFVQFFKNHGFLAETELLQWYTVRNGSASYVPELTRPFSDRIRLNTKVTSIRRTGNKIEVSDGRSFKAAYDRVIIAAHSDQALKMIDNPTKAEREVLGAIAYQPNDVVLHYDRKLLPEHKQTWSSWNYFVPPAGDDRCTVTYDMNILQSIRSKDEFLVTLNQSDGIDREKIIKSFVYDHPVYTLEAVAAQKRFNEINGTDRLYFAGAYWGYGFHEDGVNSALKACAAINPSLEL